MIYVEIASGFLCGILMLALMCWLFKLKIKGFVRLLVNALLGGVILLLLNIFGIVTLPLNPLNMLVTGFLGVFGVVLIWLIVIIA